VPAPSLPLPFKPLDDQYLAIAMSAALGSRPLMSVPPAPAIEGVGVYALYYIPRTVPRARLLIAYTTHCASGKRPIYIGVSIKAELAGADTSDGLQSRLTRHREKLNAGAGFSADDFRCRALPCDNRWAALVEHYLIQLHVPLWNAPVFKGFGSNVRGRGRRDQAASPWEVVHQRMAPGGTATFTAATVTGEAISHLTASSGVPFYRLDDTP
jgi:Eco29kI restriction endonuclease